MCILNSSKYLANINVPLLLYFYSLHCFSDKNENGGAYDMHATMSGDNV